MVQRIARVLNAFEGEHAQLSASDIASRAGLSVSTAHRLIQDLTVEGLLTRSADGGYEIGLNLWEISHRSSSMQRFSQKARPFLAGLHRSLRQNASLSILDSSKGSIVCLEHLTLAAHSADPIKVAGRQPALSTAAGLAMVAFGPRHVQERFIQKGLRNQLSDNQICAADALRRTFAQVRIEGYAHLRGNHHKRTSTTAAPIFSTSGEVLAAFCVSEDLDRVSLSVQVPAVMAAARDMTQALRRDQSKRSSAPIGTGYPSAHDSGSRRLMKFAFSSA
ncbi:IclR family transcriptional regulator [Micrococcaceae sp. AOP34-BR2-30]